VSFKLDRSLFALISVLTVVACRGDDNPGSSDTDASSSGDSSGGTGSTTGTPTPTTSESGTSTGVVDPSTSTGPVDPTTDGFETCGFIDECTTGSSSLPNGAQCDSDDQCASMQCYSNQILMFGVCAECNEDADCVAAGTGTACSLSPLAMTAVCTQGEPGSGCMSDEACMDGLFCAPVIEVPIPGVLPDTCGECSESGDCAMGQICNPELDMATLSGQNKCVEPGSVPNDGLCAKNPEGDMACMSGHCTDATVMMFLTIHICGECAEDGDCDQGQTCMPAEAGMGGLIGSTCV